MFAHFPSSGYRYFMVYCDGSSNATTSTDWPIHCRYSNDLYQWQEVAGSVFSDVDNTRDAMLFYDDTSSRTSGNQDAGYGIFAP